VKGGRDLAEQPPSRLQFSSVRDEVLDHVPAVQHESRLLAPDPGDSSLETGRVAGAADVSIGEHDEAKLHLPWSLGERPPSRRAGENGSRREQRGLEEPAAAEGRLVLTQLHRPRSANEDMEQRRQWIADRK
jgi:hypothetical protein